MKKLFIFLTFTLLLSSCFGGEEVSVEVPQVENTIQEEVIILDEERVVGSENQDIENIEGGEPEENIDGEVLEVDTEKVPENTVREPVPIEKVEIRETGRENEDYDVRANIESDPEAEVVTEETLVVPTAPSAQEIQVEDVEVSPEDDVLADDFLNELFDGTVEGLDILNDNE